MSAELPIAATDPNICRPSSLPDDAGHEMPRLVPAAGLRCAAPKRHEAGRRNDRNRNNSQAPLARRAVLERRVGSAAQPFGNGDDGRQGAQHFEGQPERQSANSLGEHSEVCLMPLAVGFEPVRRLPATR